MQDCLEDTGLLTGLNQVAVEIVKLERVFSECVGQVITGLDIGLDTQDQFLHAGILMTPADDFKGLYQGNTG